MYVYRYIQNHTEPLVCGAELESMVLRNLEMNSLCGVAHCRAVRQSNEIRYILKGSRECILNDGGVFSFPSLDCNSWDRWLT